MPLTRATITIASRVMLPAYVLFALYVGTIYATDPGARLAGSPAFPLIPTSIWGAGFVAAGVVLAAAIATRRRELFELGLAPLCVWCVIWAGALVYSAIFDGTSFSAPAFPAFVATACWASLLSLAAREVHT